MAFEQVLAEMAAAARDDIARLLMAASRAVSAEALRELDPEGVSGVRVAHVPVIASLDADGTRIVDLATRIGHTRQAVAALVRDLETSGHVTTVPDPADGRATRVRLTAAGADLCDRATALMRSREEALRAAHGEAAVDSLREVLRAMAGEGSD